MNEKDEETLRDIEYLKRYLNRPSTDEQHLDSIVVSRFDKRNMWGAMEDVEAFKQMEVNLDEKFDNGSHLHADIFQALNKAVPVLRDDDEMKPESLINRQVIEQMMKLKEYEELHDYTINDPINSALASTTMEGKVTELMEGLKEAQEKVNEALEQIQEGEISEEDLDELLEGLGEAQDSLKSGLQDALSDAADEQSQLDGLGRLWGTDPSDPGSKRMPAEERLKLANQLRNNKMLAQLADLVGAFTRFAFAMQRQKTDQVQTDIYDIETGNDLSHVLPTEFMLLANPDTSMEFMRRYSERSLMQYSLRGVEEVGKGGMVVEVDTSGSMDGPPMIFAMAIALSLLRICQRQDRKFWGVHFSSASQIKQFDLTNPTPEKILDFITHEYGYSTDFESPLNLAMDILQAEHDEDGAMKSDVVFITDGMAGVSEPFMKRLTKFKEDTGGRVFGVLIGAHASKEPLRSICDGRVFPVTKLNSPEDIRSVFQSV